MVFVGRNVQPLVQRRQGVGPPIPDARRVRGLVDEVVVGVQHLDPVRRDDRTVGAAQVGRGRRQTAQRLHRANDDLSCFVVVPRRFDPHGVAAVIRQRPQTRDFVRRRAPPHGRVPGHARNLLAIIGAVKIGHTNFHLALNRRAFCRGDPKLDGLLSGPQPGQRAFQLTRLPGRDFLRRRSDIGRRCAHRQADPQDPLRRVSNPHLQQFVSRGRVAAALHGFDRQFVGQRVQVGINSFARGVGDRPAQAAGELHAIHLQVGTRILAPQSQPQPGAGRNSPAIRQRPCRPPLVSPAETKFARRG